MCEKTLESVVEEAKSLTSQEKQQLRSLLDDWLSPKTPTNELPEETREQLMLQQLLKDGVIENVPVRDTAVPDDYIPIEVQGEPVSETIIRERR